MKGDLPPESVPTGDADRNHPVGRGRALGRGDAASGGGILRPDAAAHAANSRQFVVRLELPDRKLAPNGSHGHWTAKARLTKGYRIACAWAFAQAKPIGWKVAPVEIDVVYRHTKNSSGYRARDCQNAIASIKAGIDGMVDAGAVPNDSAKWLKWGSFEIVSRYDGERDGVYITVRQQ